MKKGSTGAAAELFVAADLIRSGHDVFRALSPHASCDLIISGGTGFTRIEVRTVAERKDGTLCPAVRKTDECDLYAFVCGNRVEYVSPENARMDYRQSNPAGDWRRNTDL